MRSGLRAPCTGQSSASAGRRERLLLVSVRRVGVGHRRGRDADRARDTTRGGAPGDSGRNRLRKPGGCRDAPRTRRPGGAPHRRVPPRRSARARKRLRARRVAAARPSAAYGITAGAHCPVVVVPEGRAWPDGVVGGRRRFRASEKAVAFAAAEGGPHGRHAHGGHDVVAGPGAVRVRRLSPELSGSPCRTLRRRSSRSRSRVSARTIRISR